MKNISIILIYLLGVFAFSSCEKDDPMVKLNEEVVTNELASIDSEYVMTMEDAASVLETFNWTVPDFGFKASITYTVQIDSAGKNFASAIDLITVDNDTIGSIKVGELNTLLLNAGLPFDEALSMEFRVKAVINPNVDPLYSNSRAASITAYPTEFPPIYMIGAAVGGWDPALAVSVYSTEPSIYSTICEFTNGEAFRFFDIPSWDATKQLNWNYFTGSVASEFENAQDGDTNIRFIGTTGFYRITVDLKAKTIAMESVTKPRLLMVGAAVPGGWDINNPTEMTWVSDGIFTATLNFTVEAFRFFTANDWGTGLNYPYYQGLNFTIDSNFENAGDGDSNFKFIGTPGTFTCTVNYWDKTITLTTPPA
jgi:hypothetical protein